MRASRGPFAAPASSSVLGLGTHRNSNGRRKRIDFVLHAADFEAEPKPLAPITDVTPLPSASEPSDHLAIQVALTSRR